MAKTFAQLLDDIKREARVKAGDDLDDWIKSVINQEYRKLCSNAEYPELLVPFAAVTIASDAQSQFTLPVGLRRLVSVDFAQDSTQPYWRSLTKKNVFAPSLTQGSPAWFFQAGTSLYLFPASSVVTTNAIRITYFKEPTALVADGDTMEVSKLEEVVIERTLARVLRYHRDDQSVAVEANAAQTEARVVE